MTDAVLSNVAPDVPWEIGAATTWNPEPWTYEGPDGNPVDLSGAVARLKVRDSHDATNVLADWSSYVTLGGVAGTITIVVPDDIIAAVTWERGTYVFEIEDSGGATIQLLRGTVTVVPGDSQ